jgi:potassium channel subfamily K
MQVYVPPIRPAETYSQGFWHAVIAAVLYLAGSMILMINMLGYFLGHYPQHFDLDEHQRTLILQTMMFFFWLAGGAAVFAKVCHLSYADALYFCDVTVLTVGFGDVLASNDVGRGLVFPYSVFGIIFLGLMINSIHQFAMTMSKENVIHKHALNERERAFDRTVTTEKELRERLNLPTKADPSAHNTSRQNHEDSDRPLHNYGRFETRGHNVVFREQKRLVRLHSSHGTARGGFGNKAHHRHSYRHNSSFYEPYVNKSKLAELTRRRRNELIILREERDRFNAMRDIQAHIGHFKSYYSLLLSVLAFTLLWCAGAAVFYVAERRIQGLTYFQCLYFCYVSLLTIGYGDYSPRSNAGKPFFVVWSLMAVPTMTILVSDLGDTIVKSYNRGTFKLADLTILPKRGVWQDVVNRLFPHTGEESHKGAATSNNDPKTEDSPVNERTVNESTDEGATALNDLVAEDDLSDTELARHLAKAIKQVSADMRLNHPKKYTYEEWVEFGLLIRFSARKSHHNHSPPHAEDETVFDEILEWDWIGEDSPMLTGLSESEWVLERLCESLDRYTRRQAFEVSTSSSF